MYIFLYIYIYISFLIYIIYSLCQDARCEHPEDILCKHSEAVFCDDPICEHPESGETSANASALLERRHCQSSGGANESVDTRTALQDTII